jgi:nicotinamide-nucleotide amidase
MRAEILSIGTEILIGSILNSNARFLSQKLAENAIDVYHHTTVGDNQGRIAEAFANACDRADIVMSTGGLGPTEDDVTVRGLSKFLDQPLVLHQLTRQQILRRLKARGFAKITKLVEKQCYLPKNVTLIFQNQYGTAPGLLCEIERSGNKKWLLILPGPPREMQPMFMDQGLPALLRLSRIPKQSFVIRTLKIAGLPESKVAQKVNDLLKLTPPLTLGIYAKPGLVELKIMAKADLKAKALQRVSRLEKKIRARLGNQIYGADDETLSSVVGKLLRKSNKTLAVAESCTGGLLGHWITDSPGSSDYFAGGIIAYDNEVKIENLGLSKTLLQKFGAVSKPVAKKMAQNARQIFKTNLAIAITGIAGPGGGTKKKPVGLVYIAISDSKRTFCKKYQLFGTREEIKSSAAQEALNLLRLQLIQTQ